MRKNIINIAICIIILGVMTMILSTNTYAGFTNENSTFKKSRVGNWEILIDGKNIETEELEINIFDTILDEDGREEKNVKKSSGEKIIAPGTMGKFSWLMENNSDTTAKYKIEYNVEFSENSLKIPFKYGKDTDGDGIVEKWTNNVSDLNQYDTILKNNQKQSTEEIWWKWEFEESEEQDKLDTLLGMSGEVKATLKAQIVVEQEI